LGTIVFSFLPALIVIVALTLALSWSSDLEDGRLELVLSTPQARARVLLERFGANVLVVLLAVVLTWLTVLIGAQLINLNINQGKVLAASVSIIPPALITLGLVYALAGRLRHTAVLGIVTGYLILSFLEETLEGLVAIPAWIGKISMFHLYGNPTFLGMDWGSFLGMTIVGIVLLVIGAVQFRSVDLARG
jgi:ABC-2 type transport system permease protein